jgi:hypothetical protein
LPQHSNHTLKHSHEMVPEVKSNLGQTVSDIRLKRNVLDENRSMLGAKLGELNIKVRD